MRDFARCGNAPDCFCANLLRAFDETCEELSEKASSKLPAFFLRCARTPCAPHCFRQSSGGFAGFCKGAFAWAHYVFSQKTRFAAWVFRLPHAGRCANLRISFAGIFFAFGAKKVGINNLFICGSQLWLVTRKPAIPLNSRESGLKKVVGREGIEPTTKRL